MTKYKSRGGEPDAARLLALARAELLNEILPNLEGEARYRARLIANALKIAAHELAAGAADQAQAARELAAFAATLASAALPPEVATGAAAAGPALRDALRAGALDGDAAFHALLVRLTERRRAALG
jgi:hypothetical protein